MYIEQKFYDSGITEIRLQDTGGKELDITEAFDIYVEKLDKLNTAASLRLWLEENTSFETDAHIDSIIKHLLNKEVIRI